ncbi:aspartate ammonia-lyase [Enterobacter sp. EGD-HP1]|nr:aspartate ammonia-lyase [Enterobacter sp. EGD-HP1]
MIQLTAIRYHQHMISNIWLIEGIIVGQKIFKTT